MPRVLFRHQSYDVSASLDLACSQEGDLHGNSNIFTSKRYPRAWEVLAQINPALLEEALAVTLDDSLTALAAKIQADCRLEVVTAASLEGRVIFHRTLALLAAQAARQLEPAATLQDVAVTADACQLTYAGASAFPSLDALHRQLAGLIDENQPIHCASWQKAVLLESFPALQTPYAQARLADCDDFDDVWAAVHGDFALPMESGAVTAYFPRALREFELTMEPRNKTVQLTARTC